MKVIVFIVFTLVYILTAGATLLAFLGTAGLISTGLKPGQTIPHLGLLISAVLVQTAGGYMALAKNFFGLRTQGTPESERKIRELTLTAMGVLRRAQIIAYQYASDLQGVMEKYGQYIAMDIDLTKAKDRQRFILDMTNEIENAIKDVEDIIRKGSVRKMRRIKEKLASLIQPLEKMLVGTPVELTPGMIGMSDFKRVVLRVGEIKSAETVPATDKLLKIVVDIAGELRQVVAGIGNAYQPKELIGRRVVVLANLQRRKIRGVESNGMIIAAPAQPGGKPALCTFTEPVSVGSRLA